MARGGSRPGSGRRRKDGLETPDKIPADIKRTARAAKMAPLDYMIAVMNDDMAEDGRRDRMAVAAAPFVHPRKEPVGAGKKEQREDAAKEASSGKFAPPSAPKLVVDNG